jgi:hypothetical protein
VIASAEGFALLTTQPIPEPFLALRVWANEVTAGLDGQDAARPDTWLRDDLWRAAMWELAGWEWLALDQDVDTCRACQLMADHILQGHLEEVCDGI